MTFADEINAQDRLATQRLTGLLDYVEALVKLDERVAMRLSQHKLADGSQFVLHGHELAGLPGLKCDFGDNDGPIWLRIQRLQRSAPPEIAQDAAEWIDVSNDPTRAPQIHDAVHRRLPEAEQLRLVAEGKARSEDCTRSLKVDKSDPPNDAFYDVMLRLEDRPDTRSTLEAYCAGPWAQWSEQEKPRRRSIAVYQRLFEIAQRLLQSGGTESIELIWGIGLSRWNQAGELIDLPMVECGVEIEIAETGNAEISVRPRSGAFRVELQPFEKLAGPRFALAEDAARRCIRSLEGPDSEGISPFRQESFEPILKICGSQLDPEGRYLPDHKSLPLSEPVPEPEGTFLTVSDRYVLYARKRSSNSVLRDIDQLRGTVAAEGTEPIKIEGSTRTLVLGPSDGIDDTFTPLGDRIGAAGEIPVDGGETVDADHGDLFFPKPFNDEQVEIIRRLEESDGLVVQGPPGTGKTHTIANIISHMLATGRRVLVVSHGETALRVIQEQLPEGVRDLAISVTTSERDGLKQVERAIGLMLGIVNSIDLNRSRQIKLIRDLETGISSNRKRLMEIDQRLAALAAPHMSPVPGSKQTPYQAAERLVESRDAHRWFADRPTRSLTDGGVSNAEMDALLAARKTVRDYLKYVSERLPSPANLPVPETVRGWHQDLIAAAQLTADNATLEPLTRRTIAKLGLDGAEKLAASLKGLASKIEALKRQIWAWKLAEALLANAAVAQRLEPLARAFLADAQALISGRNAFLSRPVGLPKELPPEKQLTQIMDALIAGKNPFGMMAFSTKAYQPVFEAVSVAGTRPTSSNDWQHVRAYVAFCAEVESLSVRWDALRPELSVPDQLAFRLSTLATLSQIVDSLFHVALVAVPGEIRSVSKQLSTALANDTEAGAILQHSSNIAAFAEGLSRHVSSVRFAAVRHNIVEAAGLFDGSECDIASFAKQILKELIGKPTLDARQLLQVWQRLRARLAHIQSLKPMYDRIIATTHAVALAGAPHWADRLRTEPALDDSDPAAPAAWPEAWEWAVQLNYLETIGATGDLARLHRERLETEKALREGFAALVKERTFYNLAATMKGSAKAALQGFANIIRRLGAGTGQRAVLHRQNARQAMQGCFDAVPCWIMPTWRVSEQLPAKLGSFDLVILDEASQSDARELPALLRGKKILVVGDDRQVSPSSAFLSIANIARLRHNFLSEFPFRAEVEPGASIYDLARVMFPAKFVMLKEHFRCVEPIIRFSMQFYNENLVPLRVPKPSERLDPPLIDIYVEDGQRRGKSKVNPPEAEIVVAEIEKIVEATPPAAEGLLPLVRSIGVISLIGAEQALHIQKLLMERIGEAAIVRHRIVCGDSATLQGDERDIVFVSMVADRSRKQSQTSMQYQQRFNVALSRARDRTFLVRSVREEELNPKDLKAKVIAHFRNPMPKTESPSADLIDLCQSEFEKAIFRALVRRGYHVTPQVGSVGFSIDMVVEGEGGRRLAVECDGDRYHGPARWADDMRRQRILERVGWTFWRCFGSNYSLDPEGVFGDLLATLERMEIAPVEREAVGRGFSEHRTERAKAVDEPPGAASGGNDFIAPFVLLGEQEANAAEEPESPLKEGDRVIVRYLDVEPSRPEFYNISNTHDDRINGYLLATSPLGKALATGSPGDELTFHEGGGDRTFLFVSLETASAQAA